LQLFLDYRYKRGYNLIDVKDIEHNLFDLTSVLLSPFFCSTHSFFLFYFLLSTVAQHFFCPFYAHVEKFIF